MTLEEFERQLSDPAPAYVIDSKDEFLCRRALELCEEKVPADSRVFNWRVYDLEDRPVEEVLAAARTLPWMAARRWIWVRNAEEGGEALGVYLRDPSPQTVLLLEAARKVRGWPKAPSVSEPRGGDDSMRRQIQEFCRRERCKIDPDALQMLLERCGRNRQLLDNELEKLLLAEFESRRIRVETVRALTPRVQGPEVFDLIRAVATGRQETALRVLHRLYDGGAHPQQILPLLHWNVRRLLVARERLDEGDRFPDIVRDLKIWSYKGRERAVRAMSRAFLSAALRELRRTDRLGKSTALDPRIRLDALVFRLVRGSR